MAEKVNVTICGGGNGTHVLAGVMSLAEGAEVKVLDLYEDEMERWTAAMSKDGFKVNFNDDKVLEQNKDDVKFTVTRDTKEVISNTDVAIICVPAFAHEVYLKAITEHLRDSCLVVGSPGQPGFEYQCLHFLKLWNKKCTIISLETLPWACRILSYGSEVMVQGTKETVMTSVLKQSQPTETNDQLAIVQRLLGPKPVLAKTDYPLEATLLTKASIHPPVMFARWNNWDGESLDSPPLFYQGVDETAAKYLCDVGEEAVLIWKALASRYSHLDPTKVTSVHTWLVEHYEDQIDDKTTLLSAMKTNRAYKGLVHPVTKTADGKYVPNFQYRYLAEDVPFGIVVLRSIAAMVGMDTPVMDEIIVWAQAKLGKEFLVDGKLNGKDIQHTRIPQNYGYDTIDDLMKLDK